MTEQDTIRRNDPALQAVTARARNIRDQATDLEGQMPAG
jgi:hypothetical protein